MSKPAVVCQQVTKTYGAGATAQQALRGIDLEINSGELFMLVGPSGSGKTTLISVIAGVLNRDSGDCRVFGNDYQAMSNGKRAAHRGKEVGFVFQSFNLIPTLTIAENVAVPLLIAGMGRARAMPKVQAVLQEVGLGDRLKSFPNQLSGGEQQRVAISRAIVHDPRLVVCDEPTSNLDHETGTHVMQMFGEIGRRSDRALVVVTHDPRIFSFADRIARMEDGRITSITNGEDEPSLPG